MDTPRRVSTTQVSFAKTKARCTDRKLGKLVSDYLANELSSEDMKKVRHHIVSCTSCAVFESNMVNLKAALRTVPLRRLIDKIPPMKSKRNHHCRK